MTKPNDLLVINGEAWLAPCIEEDCANLACRVLACETDCNEAQVCALCDRRCCDQHQLHSDADMDFCERVARYYCHTCHLATCHFRDCYDN